MRTNEIDDENPLADWTYPQDEEKSCRQLSFEDVQQALFTLSLSTKISDQETTPVIVNTCCRLLRLDCSDRLSLPLARRSRSDFSSPPSSLLCSNCMAIKAQQQMNILRNRLASSDARREIEFSLIDGRDNLALTTTSTYQSAQMLVWQMNSSTSQSYDTGSLTDDEKKILLNETIKKLQSILANGSSAPTEPRAVDLTRHALETSIRILSSSLDSS